MTKELDTTRARCALAGVALHVTDDGRGQTIYTVSRWALSRTFESLDDVSAWLDRVTGEKSSETVCAGGGDSHE
jgi:hypothetical protein